QIESDQSGATVVVDGQQREGTTPLPPLGVNAGTHTVRVSKEGFEAYQEQVLVAGGQRKTVAARLKPLSKVGRLVIKEASGKTLDIVIDGAVVGQTPVYQATVAVGPHSVFLRGKDKLGTPPSAASVKENQTSTLTLSAVELDSEIRIEPTPTNATVFVDSVQIGSGIWEGRLQSGTHKIEIAAEGFTPYRGDATLTKGKKELVKVSLERDLSNPMWQAGFVPHIYAEAFAGLALAPGFGGGADSGCSGSKCKSKSLPLGFMGGVRGGYELLRGLGVEVGFGYLYMAEKMTRTIDAIGDRNVIFTSSNYKDQTTIAGLLLMVSASYRLLDKTPLTFRVSAGVARLRAVFKNGGTFSGDVRNPCDPMINPTTCDPNETTTVTQTFSIAEEPANIWVPFVAPEARFGIRLAKKISVDFGVALFVMLAPSAVRTGKPTGDAFTNINKSEGQRAFQLNDVPGAFQNPPSDARPGIVNLPKEDGFGTFFGIMPTLGGRFDF
ncbi:MAG TPA: PEGA domain-containing protein, partial [Polyangiaceae bacterium]